MPQRDYQAYANTPRGKAVRAKAHSKWVAKRRNERQAMKVATAPLLQVINTWKTS